MKTAVIAFKGQEIQTFRADDGEIRVAMRPIVEAMGLDWSAQFKRIHRTPVLAEAVAILTTKLGEDDQNRDYVTLPLGRLNGWLFGIDVLRVKPHLRELVMQYQRECFQALFDYWHKGEAQNPRKGPGNGRAASNLVRFAQAYEKAGDPKLKDMFAKLVVEAALDVGIEPPDLSPPPVSPLAVAFFATLETLLAQGQPLNHSRRHELLAINLKEAGKAFHAAGSSLVFDGKLMAALRASETPKYVDTKAVSSAITGHTVSCWVFKRDAVH